MERLSKQQAVNGLVEEILSIFLRLAARTLSLALWMILFGMLPHHMDKDTAHSGKRGKVVHSPHIQVDVGQEQYWRDWTGSARCLVVREQSLLTRSSRLFPLQERRRNVMRFQYAGPRSRMRTS